MIPLESVEVGFFFDEPMKRLTEKSPKPCVNTFRTSSTECLHVLQRIRDAVLAENLLATWPNFIGISASFLDVGDDAEFRIFSSKREDLAVNAKLRYLQIFCFF